MLKIKRKVKLSTLKKKLDTIFSIWVRLRDADESGNINCITCNRQFHWKNSQACHYVPRRHLSTRWDEWNVNAGCAGCNMFDGGHIDEYGIALMDKYGDNIVRELNKLKKTIWKAKPYELEEKIIYYTGLVENLKFNKGL